MADILLANEPRAFLDQLHPSGLPESKALKEEAISLAQLTGGAKVVGYHEPFDDVYHAALNVALRCDGPNRLWSESPPPDMRQIFRGARKAWPLLPVLFRNKLTEQELADKLDKISDAARSLQNSLKDLNEEQAVAVLKHYRDVAKVDNWLLDFTWDPFVALFFASKGAPQESKPGDIGIVHRSNVTEWDRLSCGGTNRFGAVKIIEVPNVHRINVQRAVFVDTGHPELFRQSIPSTIRFKQTADEFEDPTLDHPITKDLLLHPAVDRTRELIAKLEIPFPKAKKPLMFKPASNPLQGLTWTDYLELAKSWIDRSGESLSSKQEHELSIVCECYRLLQIKSGEEPIDRGLHGLESATKGTLIGEGGRDAVSALGAWSSYESMLNGLYLEALSAFK